MCIKSRGTVRHTRDSKRGGRAVRMAWRKRGWFCLREHPCDPPFVGPLVCCHKLGSRHFVPCPRSSCHSGGRRAAGEVARMGCVVLSIWCVVVAAVVVDEIGCVAVAVWRVRD